MSSCSNVVIIANPKSTETQVMRNCLLPGLLKTLSANRAVSLPILLFEVSDVVIKDDKEISSEEEHIGSCNKRHLAAVYCGTTSGFEVVHGALDRLMQMFSVSRILSCAGESASKNGFYLKAAGDETFLEGRYADIFLGDGKKIGGMGVVHPEVLEHFNISHVVSGFEISVEELL